MNLQTLADLPELLALATGDELPVSRIPVAKLGAYKDKRYGAFTITREDYESWQRNLSGPLGGRAPIDFDHAPEKGQGTKAAGWITSLELEGRHVMARVEWSRAGAASIRDREYLFISPTFQGDWKDEEGASHGRTLIGAGLTNRPFLKRDMPAISLSEAPLEPAEEVPVEELEEASDSRAMPLPAIAKRLSLSEDADEATILAALPEGAVILAADEHSDLVARANAGEQAEKSLAEATFEHAFTKALNDGCTTPAMKDHLAGLPVATAVAILDASPKVVPTEPVGSGSAGRAAAAPAGVDVDRFELHERAEALAKTASITYEDAITRLSEEN